MRHYAQARLVPTNLCDVYTRRGPAEQWRYAATTATRGEAELYAIRLRRIGLQVSIRERG